MTTRYYLLYVFMVALIISSCIGEDVDVTPPGIEVISYTPSPVVGTICGTEEPNVFYLSGGGELSFDVIFKDDVALSQYKVDIHNNFDCHGHGGGSAPSVVVPNVESQTEDWTILDIQDINGKSSPIQRTFDVPANVTAGNYHYSIQVVDESGNDNPGANIFALKIFNPADSLPPVITVDEPQSRTISIKKGEIIRFTGRITDNHSLSEGGNGVIYLAYTDLSSGNTFSTDTYQVFDGSFDKSFDFDLDYVIPKTWTTGKYRLSLGANDGVRNVADFEFFELEVGE